MKQSNRQKEPKKKAKGQTGFFWKKNFDGKKRKKLCFVDCLDLLFYRVRKYGKTLTFSTFSWNQYSKNHLFLLVEVNAFELFWDWVANEFDELWLDGKCVEILCCPQLELCHVVLCLLDVDPLGIWALAKRKEFLWCLDLLWHYLKGRSNHFLNSIIEYLYRQINTPYRHHKAVYERRVELYFIWLKSCSYAAHL